MSPSMICDCSEICLCAILRDQLDAAPSAGKPFEPTYKVDLAFRNLVKYVAGRFSVSHDVGEHERSLAVARPGRSTLGVRILHETNCTHEMTGTSNS